MTGYGIYMHSRAYLAAMRAGRVTFGADDQPAIDGKTVFIHDGLPREGEFGESSDEVQPLIEKEARRNQALREAGLAA